MNEKPEALRLAEELTMNCHAGTQQNAATELRRQHDEIERLRELLIEARSHLGFGGRSTYILAVRIDDFLDQDSQRVE
jgi:hypothetical protein